MSTCIRAGYSYKRHHWLRGVCRKCGAEQSRLLFSHTLPGEPKANSLTEPPQTTEPQQDTWDKFYENHPDLGHDEFPSDFQTDELDTDAE
jgi:hypothetical protein